MCFLHTYSQRYLTHCQLAKERKKDDTVHAFDLQGVNLFGHLSFCMNIIWEGAMMYFIVLFWCEKQVQLLLDLIWKAGWTQIKLERIFLTVF